MFENIEILLYFLNSLWEVLLNELLVDCNHSLRIDTRMLRLKLHVIEHINLVVIRAQIQISSASRIDYISH